MGKRTNEFLKKVFGYGSGYGYGSGFGDGDGDGYWKEILASLTRKLCKGKTVFAFWKSTADGKPANGGNGTVAREGLLEEINGPLKICTPRALHGTLDPPKWKGERLWVVALYRPIQRQEDKIASLKRKILFEVKASRLERSGCCAR